MNLRKEHKERDIDLKECHVLFQCKLIEFDEILGIVDYLNRKHNVGKVPPGIRNMKEGIKKVVRWNKEITNIIQSQKCAKLFSFNRLLVHVSSFYGHSHSM